MVFQSLACFRNEAENLRNILLQKNPRKFFEPEKPKGSEYELKGNVSSGSRGKEKVLEEEEEEDENEKLKCKACDAILDENMCTA